MQKKSEESSIDENTEILKTKAFLRTKNVGSPQMQQSVFDRWTEHCFFSRYCGKYGCKKDELPAKRKSIKGQAPTFKVFLSGKDIVHLLVCIFFILQKSITKGKFREKLGCVLREEPRVLGVNMRSSARAFSDTRVKKSGAKVCVQKKVVLKKTFRKQA